MANLSLIKKNDFWTYLEVDGKIIGFYILVSITQDSPDYSWPYFTQSALLPNTCGFAISEAQAQQLLLDCANAYFDLCTTKLGDQNP